jgi:hypothetical protein
MKKRSAKKVATKAVDVTIKLAKTPKEGELKGQALAITNILKRKPMAKAALIEAIGKKIPSKNKLGAADLWHMNRPKLIERGYVKEER